LEDEMEKILSKELIENSAKLIEKSDEYLVTLYDEFMDFPVFEDKYHMLYIYCEKYSDAKLCRELWNSDKDLYRGNIAQYPEFKDFTNLPGYFVCLMPHY
jgi:hypothetical protein